LLDKPGYVLNYESPRVSWDALRPDGYKQFFRTPQAAAKAAALHYAKTTGRSAKDALGGRSAARTTRVIVRASQAPPHGFRVHGRWEDGTKINLWFSTQAAAERARDQIKQEGRVNLGAAQSTDDLGARRSTVQAKATGKSAKDALGGRSAAQVYYIETVFTNGRRVRNSWLPRWGRPTRTNLAKIAADGDLQAVRSMCVVKDDGTVVVCIGGAV